jgi:alcohol dehydrogenase
VHGGPAPARAYMPELLDDILKGHINPGRVFDFTTDLNDIEQAYSAMNERRAIKSLVKL